MNDKLSIMFVTLGSPELTDIFFFFLISILFPNRAKQTISSRQFIHLIYFKNIFSFLFYRFRPNSPLMWTAVMLLLLQLYPYRFSLSRLDILSFTKMWITFKNLLSTKAGICTFSWLEPSLCLNDFELGLFFIYSQCLWMFTQITQLCFCSWLNLCGWHLWCKSWDTQVFCLYKCVY